MIIHLLAAFFLPLLVCSAQQLPETAVKTAAKTPVKLHWGLPDSGAIVGKLFSYHIPKDAFSGDVDRYEVSEASSEELPTWLFYDEKHRLISGVPGIDDIGPHFVQVTAIGFMNATHQSVKKDVFSVHVREEGPRSVIRSRVPTSADEPSKGPHCDPTDPMVSLGVVLDVSFRTLTPNERRSLLHKTAKELDIEEDRLRLLNMDYALALRQEPLAAGPGETQFPQAGLRNEPNPETYLVWRIGCGDKITESIAPEIAHIERIAGNGELAAGLGYRILSWQVTSGKIAPRKRKRESRLLATATAVVRTTPRTRLPEVEITRRPTVPSTRRPPPTWPTRPTRPPRPPPPPPTVPPRATQRITRPTTPTKTRPQWPTEQREWPTETPDWPTETPDLPDPVPRDTPPRVIHDFKSILCYQGIVCYKKIHNVFEDKEDTLQEMSMTIRQLEGLHESGRKLMFIGRKNERIFGLHMEGGFKKYELNATDSAGQTASMVFQVRVADPEVSDKVNHRFHTAFDIQYDQFMESASQQIQLLRALARKLANDHHANHILVHEFNRGSVNMSWSNRSLSTEECDAPTLKGYLQTLNSETFKRKMLNIGYRSEGGQLEKIGSCVGVDFDEMEGIAPGGESPPPDDVTGDGAKIREDNFLISTVIPIVIIAALLIIAILIACILYRKNRKNKKAKVTQKKAKIRNDFVSKGTPVIFQDEIDPSLEKEPTAATPMLISEERAPLSYPPPPQAPRGFSARPQNGHPTRGTEEREMSSFPRGTPHSGTTTEHENPLYKPPPPFEPASTRSPRPSHKHTLPNQRDPPPYVPP